MPKINGRNKGSIYERTIAEKLGKALKVRLRRSPLSGGWSKETIQGDLVPVEEDVKLTITIECKNQKTIKIKDWIVQAREDAKGTDKLPLVVFHVNATSKKDKIKLSKTQIIENPFPRGEDFVVMRLDDYLKVVNKKKLKGRRK